jgi:cell division protein FtsN
MTATSLAVIVAVAWFGVGTIRSRVHKAAAPVAAPAPSATGASSGLEGRAPAGAPAPGAAVITPVPTPRDSVSHDSVASAAGTGDRYDIVVASFRTEARAASVAGQVAALGLPIRRRFTPTWQQVLAGPFASREDAAEAQLRLNRVGLTGTQIVPTAPR